MTGTQAGGALIGPHALGIIQDVEGVRHLAELGVVFLLFNIGLELSLERLRSMQKYVFGMGTAQVSITHTRLRVLERLCSMHKCVLVRGQCTGRNDSKLAFVTCTGSHLFV